MTDPSRIYSQKGELPEPDGMDVGVYYWPETVTKLIQEHMAKALEAAVMQVPGGDLCNPQHVADAIRNLTGRV